MPQYLTTRGRGSAVPIHCLTGEELVGWVKTQPRRTAHWVEQASFRAEPGSICLIPDAEGGLARVLAGIDRSQGPWSHAGLPSALPAGHFRLEPEPEAAEANQAALGWALATYRFERYRASGQGFASLVWPRHADRAAVTRTVEAVSLTRDLINTPASDLGPAELAKAARAVARPHKARVTVIAGDQLIARGYPAIHAVGRASSRAPRLIDLRWTGPGAGDKPRVTLVGKGVVFDSGGLDLKPAAGMLLMKKDMGGAAHVLGLAQMIMAARLPLRLRVLIPAVENAVSGDAFRPLDVLQTRKGLTVEVGNTDAEGRLILCDALAEADSEGPALIVDFATLTGAARIALGTDVPALFANHDESADALLRHAREADDPLWRLPLYQPYRRLLDSRIADLGNVSEGGYGGAITAALFLQAFVRPQTPWLHIDLMAWNLKARPGRPTGGEAMGLRAAYALIEELAGTGRRKR